MSDTIDLATIRAERILDALDVAAYIWAGEADIPGMCANVASVLKLNRSAPHDVRERFAERMREQMQAIVRMAFVEGAYRAFEMQQELVRQLRKERDDALTAAAPPHGEGDVM